MKVKDVSGVKVYDLSVGKSIPEWLSDKQKRQLSKDEEYRRRLELIQDFEFNTASRKIKLCRDNHHIVVTGTYPPIVKVYDVRELSLKFDRHLDAEVIQFETLSEDYSKLVFLGADRTLTFHAAYGTYYSTRIPRFGRDLLYHRGNCDLYVCGSSSQVYRLNLEQGCFLSPFDTDCPAVNTMAQSSVHQLLAFGGENGVVECWDPRGKSKLNSLDIEQAVANYANDASDWDGVNQVTSLAFDDTTGLQMAIGTHSGHCLLYDLRSSRPMIVKEHQYNMPIVGLKFQKGGENILSADAKVLKIWNKKTGKVFANVESESPINDMCVVDGPRGQSSGLVFMAGEQEKVKTYYIPQLGPAPTWASYLDSLTEELEETQDSTVYDDYKFVTRQELEQLGATHLIGTKLLKAYMHGYFMDLRLYHRVRALSEPFAFEEWRKSKVREKLQKKQAGRIKIKSNLPKVNRAAAERFVSEDKSEKKAKPSIIRDDRFQGMFEDPDFEIDEESENFKLMYPSGIKQPTKIDRDMDSDLDDDDSEAEMVNDKQEEDIVSEEEIEAQEEIVRPKKKKRVLQVSTTKDSDTSDILALGTKSKKRKTQREEAQTKSK